MMVPASMPEDFSRLCQSLLARDPVYGRLMSADLPPSYEALAGLRFSSEQENSPFLLGPRMALENFAHDS